MGYVTTHPNCSRSMILNLWSVFAQVSGLFNNTPNWSAWLAQTVEHVTPDFRIVSSTSMSGTGIILNKRTIHPTATKTMRLLYFLIPLSQKKKEKSCLLANSCFHK